MTLGTAINIWQKNYSIVSTRESKQLRRGRKCFYTLDRPSLAQINSCRVWSIYRRTPKKGSLWPRNTGKQTRNCILRMSTNYSVIHQFRVAKFDNGGSIFATSPDVLQNDACFKSGPNRLKIIGLLTMI